jgi:uncharacterized protein YlzI (FlbEa/FlbD family)
MNNFLGFQKLAMFINKKQGGSKDCSRIKIGSKEAELYKILYLGESKNTNETINILFPNDKEGKSKYYKISSRLTDKLVNKMLGLEVYNLKKSNLSKAYSRCYKRLIAIQILKGSGFTQLAIWLGKKTLTQSEFYEFNNISFEICKRLKLYYSQIAGDQKKFIIYKEKEDLFFDLLRIEKTIEDAHSIIILTIIKGKKIVPGDLEDAIAKIRSYSGSINTIRSYRSKYYYYYYSFAYIISLIKNSRKQSILVKKAYIFY